MESKKCPMSILLVDDNANVLDRYKERLEQAAAGVKVRKARSLERAYKTLTQSTTKFDMVLIDLNIPPIPQYDPDDNSKPHPLFEYGKKLREYDLNEGQALGLWLSDKHNELPYAYLTSMPVVMDPDVDDSQEEIAVIDKNRYPPVKIHDKLCELYSKYPKRQ